ncbi:MAG: fumarylacetoacetate hydrolase family protein [Acidimicrobiales bacterium]|nr:fumarylacetoacetate hydrolase family protein [Acidimicrobiales bacterium]
MTLPLPVTLAHARLTMEAVDSSEVAVPESASLAYDAQDQLRELIDSPVVGWKVGATGPASQTKLGVKAPICGPVFERTLFESGSSVDVSEFHHQPGLESEFAFTLGVTVHPGGPVMTGVSAREMVSMVHPAIELVCSRFINNFEVDPALLVADGALHTALVLGSGSKPEEAPDLVSHELRTLVDGAAIASGTGIEVLGDPYESLAWLCNHLSRRGVTLPSGSVVTTGAATGLHTTAINQVVTTDGGDLGSVALTLTG